MTYRISIEGGDSFAVATDEDCLLRGALRAGIGFPHECGVGGCGNCRFDLVSGEIETLWAEAPGLSERERKRGKHLACQARPRGDCTIKVRCDDDQRPHLPTRRLRAELVRRRDVAPGMAEFTFHSKEPADFAPGQYAIFHPPGVGGARAYSMSNLPNPQGEWRFVIRRMVGGAGSNRMFDALRPGEAITLDVPYGHAYYREDSPRDVVCVAGGSGIGPMVSIVEAALKAGRARRVLMFEGARALVDLCFARLFDLGTGTPALSYTPVLSEEAEGSRWTGARGFVHAEVERMLEQQAGACDFYFAGPPPMTNAMQELLIQRWKVPLNQIHYDRFF